MCRLDFHGTVPLISGVLGVYLLQEDIRNPYGNYPTGLLAFGWTLFALLILTSLLSLGRSGPGSLPSMPLDETEESSDSDSDKESPMEEEEDDIEIQEI